MVIISIGSTRDHPVDALAVSVERGLLGLRVSAPQVPTQTPDTRYKRGYGYAPTPSVYSPPIASIYVLHPFTFSHFFYSIDQPTSFG